MVNFYVILLDFQITIIVILWTIFIIFNLLRRQKKRSFAEKKERTLKITITGQTLAKITIKIQGSKQEAQKIQEPIPEPEVAVEKPG